MERNSNWVQLPTAKILQQQQKLNLTLESPKSKPTSPSSSKFVGSETDTKSPPKEKMDFMGTFKIDVKSVLEDDVIFLKIPVHNTKWFAHCEFCPETKSCLLYYLSKC